MTALDGGLTELLPAVFFDGVDQPIFTCDLRQPALEVERKVAARSKSSARRQSFSVFDEGANVVGVRN
jgi:hypothetical protein